LESPTHQPKSCRHFSTPSPRQMSRMANQIGPVQAGQERLVLNRLCPLFL
jgi:hypothetical protein